MTITIICDRCEKHCGQFEDIDELRKVGTVEVGIERVSFHCQQFSFARYLCMECLLILSNRLNAFMTETRSL